MDEQTARQYLADALADALFRLPGPVRLWTLLEALPPEMVMSPKAALDLLRSDPRFAPCETRWDLAHRPDLGDRPLGGALEAILQAYGRPMPAAMLLSELCLSKQGDPEDFRALLERLLRANREVGFDGERYYLIRWLVNTAATEDQRLLYLNGLDHDEAFLKAQKKLTATALKGRTPLATAEAALKAYGQPLDNRGLGLVLWRHHGDRFAAAATLSAMLDDERFLVLSGPRWLGATQARLLEKAAGKLRGQPEARPAPADTLTVLQAPPAQRLKLTEAQSRAALRLAQCSRMPVSMDEMLAEVVELRPKQRNFGPAAHALEDLLSNDLRLLRLQRGEYLSRQAVPDWVRSVPASLTPEVLPLGPRETTPDVVLRLDQLPPELVETVRSPFHEDQGETEVIAAEECLEATRIAIAYHHYRLGTMKLRVCDRRLFAAAGPITMVRMYSPDGTVVPVWLNSETRLLYGLLQWYAAWLDPSGSLLTIRRRADDPEAYDLEYDGETDPGLHVGPERFAEVMALGERLRRRRAFLTDIVTELLHMATGAAGRGEKGLAFDQLWARVNLIRRATRLQVASVLARHEQFRPVAGGRWTAGK